LTRPQASRPPTAAVSWFRAIWLLRRPAALRILSSLTQRAEELDAFRRAHPGVVVSDQILLSGWRQARVNLAAGVRIESGTVLALGDSLNGYGELRIGAGTWVGEYNNLRLGGNARILIGSDCLVSQFCSIIGVNHDTRIGVCMARAAPDTRRSGVTIGDNVWLGAGVTLLPGTGIGDGAVVASNSVVLGNIPSNEIWAGAPARRVGARR
jgi:acetyltransferase-like isoleucine patch superfamily enzyme